MFLRFVVTRTHPDSHQSRGLFRTAGALLQSDGLSAAEAEHLRELLAWFHENLPVPQDSRITDRAVFWYRSSAHECIRRMWEMANALRAHDYDVEVRKCQRLGNVVYSDDFQVAAFASPRDARITLK